MAMITAAQPKDGPEILAISAGVEVFIEEEVETVDELWRDYLNRGAQASGYHFLVFREQEHVRGYACYGPRALTEGTYDLYWIAVDKQQHGKGVGKALLRVVEEEVRSAGGRLIVIETSGIEKYAPTRGFYKAAGYLLEATLRDFYSDGDDLVIFTKHL
jgi:ribosomal protein S18 acetylase RimI-like enzyme